MNTTAKRIGSKENFIQYANAIVEGYETIIKTYECIKAVGYGMCGKVFNKRFFTELETCLGYDQVKTRVSASDNYHIGYKTLFIYLENRSVNIAGSWEYFDRDMYYTTIHNIDNAWLDAGRINPEKIRVSCDEMIEMCKKQIAKWSDAAENYDAYCTKLADALKQLGENMKGINSLFKPSEIHSFDWER